MMKRASTEVNQAYLPQNILKREIFWMLLPLRGIVRIQRWAFIDIDECGFTVEHANTSCGHAYSGVQV